MATYNGAKYLGQQLDSLAAQRRLPFELVICDDGSKDKTLEIVRKFAEGAPFPVSLYRNPERLGFADNFLKAAKLCRAEWIAFCDQDDVWLPNKLEDVSVEVERASDDLIMIVHSAHLVDAELRRSGRRLPDIRRRLLRKRGAHYGFWVQPGFAQTVRSNLFSAFPTDHRPRNFSPGSPILSHDKWTCMLANALGEVLYLPTPAALFRRHSDAHTESYQKSTFVEKINIYREIGGDYYRFLGRIAEEDSQYLEGLSIRTSKEKWRFRLSDTVKKYKRLSTIFHARADVYTNDSIAKKIASINKIFVHGGYFGDPFCRLGKLSLLKDLSATFGPKSLFR